MVIAPCVTFHGACKNALSFYADVLPETQKELQIFREVDSELRTYVTPEKENYILQARLQFSCGTTLMLNDFTSLFLAVKSTENSECKDDLSSIYSICHQLKLKCFTLSLWILARHLILL